MQTNERSQYLQKLLRKVTKLSNQVYKYQSTPRTYGTEEKLYMREAHFVDSLAWGEMDMGHVAERLEVTSGAASQIAARLEKKGYIVRKKDPTDSRHITCILTEKARSVVDCHRETDKKGYEKFGEIMSGFSQEELEVCDRFLNTVQQLYDLA